MIKIDIISKKYGDNEIIKNLHYEINKNDMVAIAGASGCGKTTLLNMLGLLDDDFLGNIYYDEIDIKKMKLKNKEKFIRNNINYLFQNYALIEDDTVLNNLLLALEYEQMGKNDKIEKIIDVLKEVGLEDFKDKHIYTLSGGEQQRIALARIMLKKGDIVLADEPTGNLDEKNKEKVLNIIKKLKKMGKTIIIVTHDKTIANECDKVLEMKK